MSSSQKTHGVGGGSSETPLAATSSKDWLEQQKCIWIQEQKIVASMVQIDNNPTTTTDIDDGNSSATIVVEDTQWCQVLRLFDSENGGGGEHNDEEGASTGSPKQRENKIKNRYYFGGVDVGFPNPPPSSNRNDENPMAVATYVIIDARTMEVVYRDHEWIPMSELPPYVSTFLAFREIQFLERLVRKQMSFRPELTPFAILVDGNGIFHPRRAGIACFLGVRTGIPTIGIGKTLLYIKNNSNTKNMDEKAGNENENNKGDDDKNDDEYRWTRSKLDKRIDVVLADVLRNTLRADDGTSSKNHHPPRIGFRKRLEIHKGLILPIMGSSDGEIEEDEFTSSDHPTDGASREQLLEGLAPFCNGIAIPLEAPPNHNTKSSERSDDDDRFRFLGAALVGHGGGRRGKGKPWIKRPIIVSVGHKMSLAEAVSITATLSLFRIPEPVRQADLYGRELLRQRKML